MALVIDILSWALLVSGAGFIIIGGIGVLRLPDVYTRAHAAGIPDTLGADLVLVGLMLQAGISMVTVKLILIFVFIFFTSPTSTHALIHTAHASGIEPMLDDKNREDGSS